MPHAADDMVSKQAPSVFQPADFHHQHVNLCQFYPVQKKNCISRFYEMEWEALR